jgi:hypothetical protein
MIRLPQSETEYRNALVDAAQLGAQKALEVAGVSKPYLKLKQAQRLYGEAVVNRWIEEGLVKKIKDGPNNASVRLSRVELEAVAMTSNRATFLVTEARNRRAQELESNK